jgi:cell division septum initiation protein DivIVA
MNLYQITQSTQQLLEMLSEGEIPEDVYKDTVESLGAENAIDDVVKAIRNKQADVEMFKAEADKFDEKAAAAQKSVDSMKKLILDYMKATDQKKTGTGLFTVSRRSSKSCELIDEAKIPEQYLIPQPAKIDKKAILAELKEGKEIAGARLKESESIMIK